MENKRLLFFNVDYATQIKIEKFASQFNIECEHVKLKDYNKTIAELIGVPAEYFPKEEYTGEEFLCEMMLFAGFDEITLDHFLTDYKQAGLPTIPLKAVVTRQNLTWSARELFNQILYESQELKLREEKLKNSKN